MKFHLLKWSVRKYLSPLRLMNYLRLLATSKKSYLRRKGWIRSLLKACPCDQNGLALPWMNYSFLFFIEERLNDQMTLLEFGSGFSTQYWARHVESVYSVEHDEFFSNLLKAKLPSNAHLLLHSKDNTIPYCEYAKVAFKENSEVCFDIVVIDGIDRVDCCRYSLDFLKDDGVVVWDDSQREEYAECYGMLYEKGFRKLEFEGIKPCSRGVDRTAVFYRDKNCLGI